jgi:hypothetical protein
MSAVAEEFEKCLGRLTSAAEGTEEPARKKHLIAVALK